MIELLKYSPIAFIFVIVGLLLALSLHEAAHAYVAYYLGDRTAKDEGRLTLNPFAHLDIFGTLCLIFFKFGWGKPVPVNPRNFINPSIGNFLVAIAGPLTNIVLAILLAGIIRLIPQGSIAFAIIDAIVYINILLAFFNLIPIPPLDGSKILGLFMSEHAYYELERFGPFILIAVIFVVFTLPIPIFSSFFNFITIITNWLTGI